MRNADVNNTGSKEGSIFGRLMKHEFRATWRIMGILLGTLAVITIAGRIYISLPVIQNLRFDNTGRYNTLDTVSAMLSVFYVMLILVAGIGSSMFLVVRFYRSMYTDEGYLTHTLPVNISEIIWTKFLTAFIWMLLTGIFIAVSVLLIVTAGSGIDFSEIASELSRMHKEIGISVEMLTGETAVMAIIGLAAGIYEVYAAISLGQLSNSHRVFMSILWYVIFYVIIQFVSTIVLVVAGLTGGTSGILLDEAGIPELWSGFMMTSCLCNLLLGALFYFITYFIAKKKLNLA